MQFQDSTYSPWTLAPYQNPSFYPVYYEKQNQPLYGSCNNNNWENKENDLSHCHTNARKRNNPFEGDIEGPTKRARTENTGGPTTRARAKNTRGSSCSLYNSHSDVQSGNSQNYTDAQSEGIDLISNAFQDTVMQDVMVQSNLEKPKKAKKNCSVLTDENKSEHIQIISKLIAQVTKPVAGKHHNEYKALNSDEITTIANIFLKINEKQLNSFLFWVEKSYHRASRLHRKVVDELSSQIALSRLKNNIKLNRDFINHIADYKHKLENVDNKYLTTASGDKVKQFLYRLLKKKTEDCVLIDWITKPTKAIIID